MHINTDVLWTKFTHKQTDYLEPLIDDVPYVDMTVRIVPDWNTSVFLDWDPIVPPDDGTGTPAYSVYSSESELGPFTKITQQPITDTSFLTDYQINDSKVYEQYFTVEVEYSDGRRYRSYPATPSQMLPKWHLLRQRDMIRREKILLRKFSGSSAIIYTPKRHGLRCKTCYDPIHEKIMDDHCTECYGTSFEGGYNTGMRTLMQFSSIDPQQTHTYYGESEQIAISAWTINYPLIHPNAIVLREADRRVFKCEGHQGSTEMLTNMQRQNVILRELSRDSIENQLFNKGDAIDVMTQVNHIHH